MENTKISDKKIKEQYNLIKEYHEKYLKQFGVKLPKLYDSHGNFTKDALVLVYIAYHYPNTRKVSKEELTKFIRNYYPNTNDVQQARHLGAQAGWWIVAGGRDNIVLKIERGSYQLYTLEQPYPGFKKGHRISETDNWDEIKEKYNFRCATCGSQEGKHHFHWPATKTILQKAHMDPNKPLIAGNIIPQCQKCNRADRNRWVYDEKGRVIKLADCSFVRNFDKDVRIKIYRILYEEFKGKKPDEIKNEK
ncbi:MAG: hypothetical protein CVT88_04565 [Candidatus Altiarchaeales archaeon HGW-Altiarchaeales-1]|nr:MAG: hypothetical protein CVT88_04565 [Candidatus Altiarchaeales archaeon HGW-Altiarchaeales-1]